MLGREPHCQLYCPAMTWRTSMTLTSLAYSTNVWKVKHGKLSKVCITCMAAANAGGNKVPMFVIGEEQKPGCLKNVKF